MGRLVRQVVGVLVLLAGASAAACTDDPPERDPSSVFEGVQGYRFTRLSDVAERSVRYSYYVNPELADRVRDVHLRTVEDEDGREVGLATVLVVDPETAAEEGFDRRVAEGFMDQGEEPRQVDLAGRRGFEGTPSPVLGGSHAVMWQEANLVVLLVGEQPRRVRGAAEAMIR